MKNLLTVGILAAFALVAWIVETWHDARRPPPFGKRWLAVIFASLVALMTALTLHFAHARDLGQWDAADPAIVQWYESLMQPDVPQASCCGEADAYWCDDISVRDGRTFCRITDDRPDGPRRRPHRELGSEFEIPPNKLKYDRGNPTGHAVIFLSRGDYVYCFVQNGGV